MKTGSFKEIVGGRSDISLEEIKKVKKYDDYIEGSFFGFDALEIEKHYWQNGPAPYPCRFELNDEEKTGLLDFTHMIVDTQTKELRIRIMTSGGGNYEGPLGLDK